MFLTKTRLGRLIFGLAAVLIGGAMQPGGQGSIGAANNREGEASPKPLPRWDFTQPGAVAEWKAQHDIAALRGSPEGMVIEISGEDPYLAGPPRDFPPGQPLWLRLRLRSDQAGSGQLFYYRDRTTEGDSVRFPVRAGAWDEIRVPLPPLGPGYRFRLDPPGRGGTATVAWLRVEPRVTISEPEWPRPSPPDLGRDALVLRSGDLELLHARDRLGAFSLRVAGDPVATGLNDPLIGYLSGASPARWLRWSERATVTTRRGPDGLLVRGTAVDADGAGWTITQRFRAAAPGAIDVETRVTVSQERSVLFLPMLALLPGAGSFGEAKGQGLFAGLEYLDNEPSSSEADLIGPAAKRQVPDSLKITFPLIAIQARDRYVGLTWSKSPVFSALFDSPDRTFHGGGHLMGVLFPGSDGSNRAEGSLLPYAGQSLSHGAPLVLHATILGGRGKNIVPAVQQYVELRGLHAPPAASVNRSTYIPQAAAGWLDSGIREGARYRHAYPGNFAPHPAADASLFIDWLAVQTRDAALRHRLEEAAAASLAAVKPADYDAAAVSHVHYPAVSLVYGHLPENLERARARGKELLQGFEPDGTMLYRPRPGGLDFGRTHFSREANGLAAPAVAGVLEAAAFTGDPELAREGLRLLHALDKFHGTVPRGAQTWEVPLHTPDILASAHLVRAYTLGYELSGDPHFLDEARYWAWTGVPFVYLVPPTDREGEAPAEPVGLYATTPVLGATHWRAPVWMGLPVQWCGLVYADALYRLQRHDPAGPWNRLADGITASGIQQSWPAGSDPKRQGLLPDSFNLRVQVRNDVAINPGTVQANAVRLLTRRPLYDFHAFRTWNALVHAPGLLSAFEEHPDRLAFRVEGWPARPYSVLVAGLGSRPRVQIDGREVPLASPHQFLEPQHALVLQVRGSATIEMTH
jgi:hypothetical protein